MFVMKKRYLTRYVWSLLLTLLCNCIILSYGQQKNLSSSFVSGREQFNSTGNEIDAGWYSDAQSYILQQEFFFKTDPANRTYTINQPQRKGYLFDRLGFTVSPILFTEKPEAIDDWNIAIKLKSIGKEKNLVSTSNYSLAKSNNKLD